MRAPKTCGESEKNRPLDFMDSHLLSHPDVRLFFYAFLLLLGIYVSVMCTCFGTLSIRKVRIPVPLSVVLTISFQYNTE